MFPFIRTADEARRAVAACRYPPAGMRGFNPREASNFFKDLNYYLATANDRIVVMLQVEHVDAVNNLDELLRVPGVDALLIGPADLSFSLGVPLQREHSKMQEAVNTTIHKARAAGIPIGIAGGNIEAYKDYLARGVTFIPLCMDYDLITMAGTELLNKMRALPA